MKHINWRGVLATAPLPMLALAASFGVYQFALLFVPFWVAVVQAAAFELTYTGLAVLTELDDRQRRRASAISIGAVVVSILYNSLAGLFHRMPDLLGAMGLWGNAVLAILHGAPLAWVAYLVSDLLLHRAPADAQMPALAMARQEAYPEPEMVSETEAIQPVQKAINATFACPTCGASLPTAGAMGAAKRWGHCPQCK